MIGASVGEGVGRGVGNAVLGATVGKGVGRGVGSGEGGGDGAGFGSGPSPDTRKVILCPESEISWIRTPVQAMLPPAYELLFG